MNLRSRPISVFGLTGAHPFPPGTSALTLDPLAILPRVPNKVRAAGMALRNAVDRGYGRVERAPALRLAHRTIRVALRKLRASHLHRCAATEDPSGVGNDVDGIDGGGRNCGLKRPSHCGRKPNAGESDILRSIRRMVGIMSSPRRKVRLVARRGKVGSSAEPFFWRNRAKRRKRSASNGSPNQAVKGRCRLGRTKTANLVFAMV